jgi:hypothetical protein
MPKANLRVPTRGYFTVPNSFVENQALMTRAECVLSLIVLRRGGVDDRGVTVSDRNWTSWTGLSPRLKEYAEAGLKEKKTLVVDGRGKSAKYAFNRSGWDHFVMHAQRSKPARTHDPKRAQRSKPGLTVHPDCNGKGCALLAAERQNEESLVSTTQLAQPVAQTMGVRPVENSWQGVSSSTVTIPPPNVSSPAFATQLAQPVAQITDAAAQVWAATLRILQSCFPLAGVAFLVRLVAVVRALFPDVQDAELARAVEFAWNLKKHKQTDEGMFLQTVPEALGHLRHKPAPRESPPSGAFEGARRIIAECIKALRARGAPFDEHADACTALLKSPELTNAEEFAWKIEQVYESCAAIKKRILSAAVASLDDDQRRAVDSFVEHDLIRRGFTPATKSASEIDQLRTQLRNESAASELSIPRLDLYYA